MKRTIALPIFAFSAVLLLAACGPKGTKTSSPEPSSETTSQTSTTSEKTSETTSETSVTSEETSTTSEESSQTSITSEESEESSPEESSSDDATYYTIRFDSNGGSPVDPIQVKEGELATRPEDPSKEGATFINWYITAVWEDEFIFDWTQPIDGDYNLIAYWSDTQGGGGDPISGGAWKMLGIIAGAEENWDYSKGVAGKATVDDPNNFAEFSLALKANDVIKFTDGAEGWLGYGALGQDYSKFVANYGEAVVDEDDSNNDNILIKYDGNYNFYLKEETVDEEKVSKIYMTASGIDFGDLATGWYIRGNGAAFPDKDGDGNTDFDPDDGFELKADAENLGHITLTFGLGDTFKITDGTHWYGAKALGQAYGGLVADEGSDPDIKVAFAGEYTLYFNSQMKIYATEPEGAPEPVKPVVTTPEYLEGSEAVNWWIVGKGATFISDWATEGGIQLHNNPNNAEDRGAVLNVTFTEGDVFKFTDGADVWSSNFDTNVADTFSLVSDGVVGHNISCAKTGVYDVYVNKDNKLWIQLHA